MFNRWESGALIQIFTADIFCQVDSELPEPSYLSVLDVC